MITTTAVNQEVAIGLVDGDVVKNPPNKEEVRGILFEASKRRTGFIMKVGRVGGVHVSPVMYSVTSLEAEHLDVEIRNGIVVILVHGNEYSPGNTELNNNFLEWLEHAKECQEQDVNYGNPTKVCFDKIWQ